MNKLKITSLIFVFSCMAGNSFAAEGWTAHRETEESALNHAEKFLELKNLDKYSELRQSWQNAEKEPARWLFLDLDAKLLQGDIQGAIALLSKKVLKGREETDRLVRLAGLHIVENPAKAAAFIDEAIAKDPQNADLHTFKAEILESAGRNEAAEAEYIAAVQNSSDDPFMREQLADFYIRSFQYEKAIQILADTLSPPSSDSIWLKALFWDRMASPSDFRIDIKGLPKGEFAPFASYIFSLLPGVYWDAEAFDKLPESESYLKIQQETFWLRLVDALKKGDEKLASDLLNYNRFRTFSWAPQVEDSLKTILAYRSLNPTRSGTFLIEDQVLNDPGQFIEFLASYSKATPEHLRQLIPGDYHDLLMNKEVFLLPFLVYGWKEVALQLNVLPVIPQEFPEWVAYRMVHILRETRTDAIALDFALKQHAGPPLSLLIANLALMQNARQTAYDYLLSIYKLPNIIGQEAALLIHPLFVERGQFQLAKEAIRAHPEIASTIEGREELARLAISSGDVVEATFLYAEIEGASAEAKSFLATKAFKEQNWEKARKLTEELLLLYPGNQTLQDNLKQIIAEEKHKIKSR